MFEIGAAVFWAAIMVTNVDVKSPVVSNGPLVPTRTFAPPILITTTKQFSTPMIRYTEPAKVSEHDPMTSFLEPSPVKTIYVFDYVLNQPIYETARPGPSAEPPRQPLPTNSIPKKGWTDGNALPHTPRTDQHSTADGRSSSAFYSTSHPLLENQLPRKFFPKVLSHIKARIFGPLVTVAPRIGLITRVRTHYMHYLRGIPTVEDFKLSALELACHTSAKDREIASLRQLRNQLQAYLSMAVYVGEEDAKAMKISEQESANEIAQLKSTVEEERRALSEEQDASKLLKQQLAQAKNEAARLEMEKESSRETLKEMRDDWTRGVRRLTDLAIEKDAETLQRRKTDKATIEGLERRIETDAKTILELKKEASSIPRKEEALTAMTGETQKLKEEIKRLKEEARNLVRERDGALKDRVEARAAVKGVLAQLNAQVDETNVLLKNAETKLSEQEALTAEAVERKDAAEERATKQEARAAEAEASCEAAEGKVTGVKADAKNSNRYLHDRLDTAEEALQGGDAVMEGQDPGIWLDTPAPASSDASSHELLALGQPPVCLRLGMRPHYTAYQRSRLSRQEQEEGAEEGKEE